jgi:hypothetical protein
MHFSFVLKKTRKGGGVPPKNLIYCDLKPQAKFQNHTITPSGRKVSVAERKKEEKKKNAFNSGHLVL